MGVENVVHSSQTISYGFISLFFFPIVFGFLVYSLSKYDEYLSGRLIVNSLEGGELKLITPFSEREQVEIRVKDGLNKNFVLDAMTLMKGYLNPLDKIVKSKKILKIGAISLLATGATTLILIDAIKDTSNTISPVQAELTGFLEWNKISVNKKFKSSKVQQSLFISNIFRTNNLKHNNTYKPYSISNKQSSQELINRIVFE